MTPTEQLEQRAQADLEQCGPAPDAVVEQVDRAMRVDDQVADPIAN